MSGSSNAKTALVTGAAKRLGRAIAGALAQRGVNVVVHYGRSKDAAIETARELRTAGVKAWTLQADLSDRDASAGIAGRATELAGPLDILINNASIFDESRLDTAKLEDFDRNIQVNALAPFALARDFAAQGREGHIINVLDAKVVEFDEAHAAYHVSKRMLFTLTRMMALEFAPRLQVNAVAPGLVLPPPGRDERYLEGLHHTVPLQRHGSAQDIARAVNFLLDSAFITGQILFVDGGRHMKGATYG